VRLPVVAALPVKLRHSLVDLQPGGVVVLRLCVRPPLLAARGRRLSSSRLQGRQLGRGNGGLAAAVSCRPCPSSLQVGAARLGLVPALPRTGLLMSGEAVVAMAAEAASSSSASCCSASGEAGREGAAGAGKKTRERTRWCS
jgi:hypothetical protein